MLEYNKRLHPSQGRRVTDDSGIQTPSHNSPFTLIVFLTTVGKRSLALTQKLTSRCRGPGKSISPLRGRTAVFLAAQRYTKSDKRSTRYFVLRTPSRSTSNGSANSLRSYDCCLTRRTKRRTQRAKWGCYMLYRLHAKTVARRMSGRSAGKCRAAMSVRGSTGLLDYRCT